MIIFGDRKLKEELKKTRQNNRELREENLVLVEEALNTENIINSVKNDKREEINELTSYQRREIDRLKTDHKLELHRLETNHEIALDGVTKNLNKLEKRFEATVDKEVASVKKDYKNRMKELDKAEDRNEKAFNDRMKKLEADYAAKIAKCDSQLEADKVSYRKYIRSEFNSRVETLEKENKALVISNAKLQGENGVLEVSRSFFTGKTESMGDLANKLADGIVKALPDVSADITTPEVNVHMPAPAVQGGKQGGGEQKKN